MKKEEIILREEAGKLLAEGRVQVIVGYEKGTLALTSPPCFITDPREVDRLVWDPFCTQNLAMYVNGLLTRHKDAQKRLKPEDRTKMAVGIVARGCTSRSLMINLQERQYARDEVFILGLPCEGYIDRRKLAAATGGDEISRATVLEGELLVETSGGETRFSLSGLLADNCLTCLANNPIISDIMIGEPAPPKDGAEEYKKINEMEAMTEDERWAYFSGEMARCIRCYACRNACPSCYCRSCFVEQTQPSWVGLGVNPADTAVFQTMRIFHMAGRCVDCGTCVDVCPMGVDLRTYLKKIDKDGFETFGHRAGMSLEEPALLATFRENDPEDFIFEPGEGHK